MAAMAAMEYTAAGKITGYFGNSAVSDGTNLYFCDITSASTQIILQMPLTGGPTITLYVAAVPILTSPWLLIGSNGTSLVVTSSFNSVPSVVTSTLGTLPIGTTSATVTPIGESPYSGSLIAFLQPTTAGMPSTDLLERCLQRTDRLFQFCL
jgi:hypothetical protein